MTHLNILDAAFHLAHDYKGGVPALAHRMGNISHNVLNNKVDPNKDSHHLRLDEALKISAITGDMRILHALSASLNHVSIPLPTIPESSDMSLLDGFMDIIVELGQFTTEFQTAWADGDITPKEVDRLKKEASDVQQRLAAFVQRIEHMVA